MCLDNAYILYHECLTKWLRIGSRHNNIVIAGNNKSFDNEPSRSKRTKNLKERKPQLKWLHLKAQEGADQLQSEANQGQQAQRSHLNQVEFRIKRRIPNQGPDQLHHLSALQQHPQLTPMLNSRKHS